MDFNSTVKGSMMEGFFPEGWDLEKIDEICSLEVDFLNSLEWDTHIELPFEHVNKHWPALLRRHDEHQTERLDCIIRDISFLLCSEHYLDLPPSCIASAVLSHHLSGVCVPVSISTWVSSEQDSHGEEFEYVQAFITALAESLGN